MMDINKKLQFYKSGKNTLSENKTINAPVNALAQHFSGEIISPEAPYIKISRVVQLPGMPDKLDIRFLSKGQMNKEILPENCLFFDLETTGLAGGAGTFAFLLGFGFIRNDELIIEQYFLPDYGREYDLFKNLKEWLNNFSHLVSFNGKSYDLPLLKNRFILNRIIPSFQSMLQIDLLHISRRLWKDSIDSCKLSSIESHLFGITRSGDIPGALIPQAYFDFIRTGVVHNIIKIIEHNYQDILSSARILMRIHEIESNPAILTTDPQALLRFAGLAFENGHEEILNLVGEMYEDIPDQIKVWQSIIYKKNKSWQKAVFLWNELTASQSFLFFALEELAKYHEHVKKDHKTALSLTNRAIKNLENLSQLDASLDPELYFSSFQHRKMRLLLKLS
ncbi:MAG: ribonuclease H-like domain-containing protein [Calditrichaceae bacterium]